jgi:Na+-driven multidrug efflux pump
VKAVGRVTPVFRSRMRELCAASVPLVLGSSAATLMTFIDGLFVAAQGVASFNALILALPPVSLVSAVASGVGVAASDAYVKAAPGPARDRELLVCGALGLAASVALVAGASIAGPAIAHFYGIDASSGLARERDLLLTYWHYLIASFPLVVFLTVALQLLVAAGKRARATTIVLVIATANLVLDAILIVGLGLGVAGAAVATDLAFALGAGLAWRSLAGTIGWPRVQPMAALVGASGRQLRSAGAVFCSIGVFVVGDLLFGRLAAGLGASAITVLGIADQLKSIIQIPTRGIMAALITILGADLAARRAGEYFPVYWASAALVGVVYLAGACFLLLLGPAAVGWYGGLDPMVRADAVFFLRVAAIGLVLQVPGRVAQAGFLALGYPAGMAAYSVLVVGAAYAGAVMLQDAYGIRGMAVGQMFGLAVANAVSVPYFLRLLRARRLRDSGSAAPAQASPLTPPTRALT